MADEVTYEDDIVLQLRRAAEWTMLNCQRHMLQCAADEIEKLRGKPQVQDDNERGFVTITMPAHMAGDNEAIARFHSALAAYASGISAEVEPKPTLTDAERQAIKEAADAYEQNNGDPDCERIADTLHGLLKRTR